MAYLDEGSPADEAGRRRYDVIVAIDGRAIASEEGFYGAVQSRDTGEL